MPTDDRYDPAAAYAERFGPVTPSRYSEGQHDPATHDDRSNDDDHLPYGNARLRELDDALRERDAPAVAERARTRREHGRDRRDSRGWWISWE